MSTVDPTPSPFPTKLPTSALLLAAGGLLLVLGAFLPWVEAAQVFGVSGIGVRWGIATLLAGVFAAVAAFGSGRIFARAGRLPVMIAAVVLGSASLLIALYVGLAIRGSVAETGAETASTGDPALDAELDEFSASLEEAFAPKTGIGVYSTALGGVLVLAGGVLSLRDLT